jgi:Ca-activated chloride channel family protein
MRFEYPHLLWLLLLLVPAVTAFFWWSWRVKRQLVAQFVAARLLADLTVGVSKARQKARIALIVIGVGLLVVVLARPQLGFSWEEARSRGLDIVVAIDTSRSMLATDVLPSRLRRAQLAALDLKRLAKSDRLGLVAFAGSAFLQCPLTLDDEAFRQSVEALDVNIIPQGGTALAEAIYAAKDAFKQGNENHKVLVFFTDGEDHDGNALEAAKAAGKEGLRIFTVGVGTANGELLRTVDVQGRTEFIKDDEGNAVKSRLNETLLRDMAQETGGFFLLLSGANTVNLLYERGLAPLPKSELASQRIKRYHERYQWLLGLVLVLLLVEMLLPERKSATAASESVLPESRVGKAAALVGALILLPAVSQASPGKALKQYQTGRYDRALEEYERVLKSRPDDPRLHFNAGTSAFQNRDYDQALDHLNSALMTQDLPTQHKTYYNIGNTRFRLGEAASDLTKRQQLWEQAVGSYESALKLDPKDADAQFNHDFVKQKLEELKQQQKQQQEKQQQNKDEQKDKQEQQQSKDQQSKDQQSKDQQQAENQKQKQEQEKNSKSQEQQQAQDQASKQEKKGDEKNGQQASQKQDKGQEQSEADAQPEGSAVARMTPMQAMQLLEALKGEEKVMTFRPVPKTNRQDRVFKDW